MAHFNRVSIKRCEPLGHAKCGIVIEQWPHPHTSVRSALQRLEEQDAERSSCQMYYCTSIARSAASINKARAAKVSSPIGERKDS